MEFKDDDIYNVIINYGHVSNKQLRQLECLPKLLDEFTASQDNYVVSFQIMITRWRLFRLELYSSIDFKTHEEMLADIDRKIEKEFKNEGCARPYIMIARSLREFGDYKSAFEYYIKANQDNDKPTVQNEIGSLALVCEHVMTCEQGIKYLLQYKKRDLHTFIESRRNVLTLCEKLVTKIYPYNVRPSTIEHCEMYYELALEMKKLCIEYYKEDDQFDDRFYCNRRVKNILEHIEKLKKCTTKE
jgi:tetratricopeptide (TPR) repeat protein